MSFREKTAWVTLIAILLVSALFFFHSPDILSPEPDPWAFHALLASLAAFVVIEVVAYIVLYVRYPKDARTPKDEREQLIALKATSLAARVYVVGSFLAIAIVYHLTGGRTLAYFLVLAFVIAEIVNYAARIIYYRRGS